MCGPRSVRNGRVELPVDRSGNAVVILVEFHQPEIERLGARCFAPYSGRIDNALYLDDSHILGVGFPIHRH